MKFRLLTIFGLSILLVCCGDEQLFMEGNMEEESHYENHSFLDWNLLDREPCNFNKPVFPDAFTPNADGENDVWEMIFHESSLDGEVAVYNRWGELIYQHGDVSSVNWNGYNMNGTPAPPGVYVYVAKIIQKTDRECVLKGSVSLIR